jgi:hypothetical protein
MRVHKQNNLDKNSIVFYTRYVDNILILYEHKTTTHTRILNFAISVHSNLKLILTQEIGVRLSFLVLLMYRTT